MSERILITGGSGFIGANVVESLLRRGCEVLSTDIKSPMNPDHSGVFRKVDILDADSLSAAIREFQPEKIVHLAARTDLDGADLEAYRANTDGVQNLIAALAVAESVRRCVFVSTKLVCRNDYAPTSFDDYCPDTMYGRSKVVGEKLVKESSLNCRWCLARPTGIWGPWFGVPYRGFFQMVARGRYLHPGGTDAPKSFGYVGNVVYQIEKLLAAEGPQIDRQTFYLADYSPIILRQWADMISMQTRSRPVRKLPGGLMRLAGKCGDVLKACGMKNPPVTSFRLRNMRADTSRIPLDNIQALTGPLPFSVEQGVEETITWLRSQNLIG